MKRRKKWNRSGRKTVRNEVIHGEGKWQDIKTTEEISEGEGEEEGEEEEGEEVEIS